jgi:DNA-binding NarL/FixJ family response regulator
MFTDGRPRASTCIIQIVIDKKTTLVIADDHANVRRSVRALLEDEPDLVVVGEAGSGLEAIRLVDALHPDVLLLDMLLGDISGIEVTRQVKNASPQTNVVIFSMYGNRNYIAGSQQAGARGYLLKKSAPEELIRVLRVVSMGGQYFAAPSSSD